jgi:hypothetical protein
MKIRVTADDAQNITAIQALPLGAIIEISEVATK